MNTTVPINVITHDSPFWSVVSELGESESRYVDTELRMTDSLARVLYPYPALPHPDAALTHSLPPAEIWEGRGQLQVHRPPSSRRGVAWSLPLPFVVCTVAVPVAVPVQRKG